MVSPPPGVLRSYIVVNLVLYKREEIGIPVLGLNQHVILSPKCLSN